MPKKCSHDATSSSSSSNSKKYLCTWVDPKTKKRCTKSFVQKGNYQQHMRMHQGVKPHACEWPGCTMTFTSSSNRNDHMRRHQNDKPYVCTHIGCGESFFRRYQLAKHALKAHEISETTECQISPEQSSKSPKYLQEN